jgi:DNA polymerase-1
VKTLYLIDSYNIIFRAFHAIQNLKNSRGLPTNAVFGFANMLLKLVRDRHPDAIAAVWDPPTKTFRDELYTEYKATRSEMPQELGPQVPLVKQMLEGFQIPNIELAGFEADDVIATLARRARDAGWNVVIISGDKDLMQLVDGNIALLDTMKDKLYDRQGVIDKWGVPPEKLGDVLALMGDAVDNVPGVPGVGEKTAVKLITEYGSLTNLLASTASIKGKLREKLETHEKDARLSRQLVELHDSCDLPIQLEELTAREPDKSVLGRFFQEMEFRRLAAEFESVERQQELASVQTRVARSLEDVDHLLQSAKTGEQWVTEVIAPDVDLLDAAPTGIVLGRVGSDDFTFVPIRTADVSLDAGELAKRLAAFLRNGDIRKCASDSKAVYLYLLRAGESALPVIDDLRLMSYVYNPAEAHDLDACVLRMLDLRTPAWETVCGKGKGARLLAECTADEIANVACARTQSALACVPKLEEELRRENMYGLYESIERPLVPVLARLEQIGIRVDRDRLGQLSGELGERMTAIETQIYEHAGGPFNIQSPKQLNEILFDKLQYPTKGIKKTKTGQLSTDSDVLEKLALQFPLPKLILEFRTVAKLKGTYVDALPPLIREDGRIHTRFNQLVAVTGRLSSTDPNLQNIPIRDEEGRKIREAFVPAEGNVLMSFDYSQVELRILAHIADDAILQDSFAKSEDVHRRTAAEVFGVMPGLVDANMRRKAKAVNFGIAYGQTAYGLSTALGIGAGEAQGIIDRYFERYQGVKAYLERMPQLAREQGFVSTLFGRRRLLPDIHAGNVQVRQFAERNAINTPIQGTAADMIKLAMIRIDEALQAQGFRSRMMLQVHDELLFDVVPEEQEKLTTLVKELMEGVLTLKVPLVVDVGAGKSWAAAH